jgi:hypothetical protein
MAGTGLLLSPLPTRQLVQLTSATQLPFQQSLESKQSINQPVPLTNKCCGSGINGTTKVLTDTVPVYN